MSSYTVITGEPTPAQYAVSSSSAATARRSLDEAQVLLEWAGEVPPEFSGLVIYDHAEALALMATPAWSEPTPWVDPGPKENPGGLTDAAFESYLADKLGSGEL